MKEKVPKIFIYLLVTSNKLNEQQNVFKINQNHQQHFNHVSEKQKIHK